MPYWVYGNEVSTGKPSEPLICDAEDEASAREIAQEQGIAVEEVEYVCSVAAEEDTALSWLHRHKHAARRAPRPLSRGGKWVTVGTVLAAVSYVVSIGINDCILSQLISLRTPRQLLIHVQKFHWQVELTKLSLLAGMAMAAAGAIMLIVDSSPRSRIR